MSSSFRCGSNGLFDGFVRNALSSSCVDYDSPSFEAPDSSSLFTSLFASSTPSEAGSLLTLVKSLTRDMDERREAVGLLLDLLEIQTVRRGIGRIQGCIGMLVAMLNGDDLIVSHDSGKLLNVLSSNTQNALHMAETGYFKPLILYLKEGSDMSKILMATSISRMELTVQTRASLGQDGAIEPLVQMFITGKLEAKLSSLSALQKLSS